MWNPTLPAFKLPMSLCSTPPQSTTTLLALTIAPSRVLRGVQILATVGRELAHLGQRPLVVGGQQALAAAVQSNFQTALEQQQLQAMQVPPIHECSEEVLTRLRSDVERHQADFIIGIGGGKVMDAAKLLAFQCQLPIATIPTTAATCAGWTALSNVYSDQGAFLYDVSLAHCPELLILDYHLIQSAPQHTLIAGIGDALAKWYEASVSSGHSQQTLIIAAVQQARVLRDILFQKTPAALAEPGGAEWQEVVDATLLMAGVMGGLGGAQCRTVAAHAVHNGLTHLPISHGNLHGAKVAYGILVQLRLEELIAGNQLAIAARQQLLEFYRQVGLPCSLQDLGLSTITLKDLQKVAEIACAPQSDIHRLPFPVTPDQLMAAMVSTVPCVSNEVIE
jgi:glycerol dehydrogenase-like iron-containing ADH family enzyme